ncbi:hypothetical protein [Streptomyces sp. UNOC14_S4]|uniref:hypothetical protein n=1 Tax=Streptomyces sp. UNOC14_S4 TaxID=2872340 RepID=UPI001E321135|nr:hypothetical protein [Streptomyces sp. UNOC14_S4]MCC3770796.1 hypothetical protein [Streptomyces sp. UNOC14_S4]
MIALAHASVGPYTIVKGDARSCRTCRWLNGVRERAWARGDSAAVAACDEHAARHFHETHRVGP